MRPHSRHFYVQRCEEDVDYSKITLFALRPNGQFEHLRRSPLS
jgi:hypothetical protein